MNELLKFASRIAKSAADFFANPRNRRHIFGYLGTIIASSSITAFFVRGRDRKREKQLVNVIRKHEARLSDLENRSRLSFRERREYLSLQKELAETKRELGELRSKGGK